MKYLIHVFNTIFCTYQRKFNDEWDVLLNKILDEGEVVKVRDHTISILYDEVEWDIWTSNKFYCYAHLYSKGKSKVHRSVEYRPRFKTMLRVEKLRKEIIDKKNQTQHSKIYNRGEGL